MRVEIGIRVISMIVGNRLGGYKASNPKREYTIYQQQQSRAWE
jgi:hypothetical protein